MSELVGKSARRLCTTDELVAYYAGQAGPTRLELAALEVAIPAAIDALYTNRDGGGNMHSAGAEAAVAALEACREAGIVW